MSRSASASRRSDPEGRGDDSARTGFVEVNLDEKDPAKAIERRRDQELPPSSEDTDGDGSLSTQEQAWLDRNKAVRKRMGRMNRQFNQQIAEIQAERQRERAEWERKFDSLKADRERPQVDEAKHNADMAELERQLEAAHEAGNSKEVVRLTRAISQKDAAFLAAKQAAIMGVDPNRQRDDGRRTRREEEADEDIRPRRQENRNKNGEGRKWTELQDWWDDDEFAPERAAAVAIDKILIEEEGSDPDSRQHYAELSKRLRKKFPKLEVVPPKGKKAARGADEDDEELEDDDDGDGDEGLEAEGRRVNKRSARRPPVPSFSDRGNDAAPARRGSRSVVLTEADRAEMRRFKMDPDNDDDVRNWAESVEETDRAYSR